MITRLLSPLVPGLLIVSIGFFLTDFLASLGYVHQIALRLLPYALGTVVLVLCYVFHRHQVFFGALTLLSAYALIQVGLQTKMEQPQAYVLYSLLSVLIPVHLALVSMFSEKGLVTPIGLIRLGAILSSFMLLGLMWGLGYLPELIDDLPTSAIEVVFEGRFLSNLAGVFYLAAFCIAVLYFIPSRGHSEASLVIAIASTLIMLIWFDQANISSIMISCALMTMAVAVMRSGSDMAYIDELTEIPGRRALQRKLSLIGKRYTLVMVDIDHFKKFNDTYGHDVGDQVLRLVASKLAKVNGGGSAFRYGGEEFTLLFPRKTA
ncbi:MAG: GGDEF domain-containing protein, partial [Pontibacterium sp.]